MKSGGPLGYGTVVKTEEQLGEQQGSVARMKQLIDALFVLGIKMLASST